MSDPHTGADEDDFKMSDVAGLPAAQAARAQVFDGEVAQQVQMELDTEAAAAASLSTAAVVAPVGGQHSAPVVAATAPAAASLPGAGEAAWQCMESLASSLPLAITATCPPPAKVSRHFVIATGIAGTGKSTLLEAVTEQALLLPSSSATKSLTMVPTWLFAAPTSDDTFTVRLVHSVKDGRWQELRDKTINRWLQSLQALCDSGSETDSVSMDAAVDKLLEDRSILDAVRSVYPFLSPQCASVYDCVERFAPETLSTDKTDAKSTVMAWLQRARADHAIAAAAAAAGGAPAVAAPVPTSPSTMLVQECSGVQELSTRSEQTLVGLSGQQVRCLLSLVAVDHRDPISVLRLLCARAVLQRDDADTTTVKKIFTAWIAHYKTNIMPTLDSKTSEGTSKSLKAAYTELMERDLAHLLTLRAHLRSAGQRFVFPVDVLNLWPLISRVEVSGPLKLPPHVCLVDSAGCEDDHQVIDPIHAVVRGLQPSRPARIWYLTQAPRCESRTKNSLPPLLALLPLMGSAGINDLRLVLTHWDDVENPDADTAVNMGGAVEAVLQTKATGGFAQHVYPVTAMVHKALTLKGVDTTQFKARLKPTALSRFESTSHSGPDDLGLDAEPASTGVELLTSDLRAVESEADNALLSAARAWAQDLFNTLQFVKENAQLQRTAAAAHVTDDTESDDDAPPDHEPDKLRAPTFQELLSEKLNSTVKQQSRFLRAFSKRPYSASAAEPGTAAVSSASSPVVASAAVVTEQQLDAGEWSVRSLLHHSSLSLPTEREVELKAFLESELEYIHHPRQLDVLLATMGDFLAGQKSSRGVKRYRLPDDLPAKYQTYVSANVFWEQLRRGLSGFAQRAEDALRAAVHATRKELLEDIKRRLDASQRTAQDKHELYSILLDLQHVRLVNTQLQQMMDQPGMSVRDICTRVLEQRKIKHSNLAHALKFEEQSKYWLSLWENVKEAVKKKVGVKARTSCLIEVLSANLQRSLTRGFHSMLRHGAKAVLSDLQIELQQWVQARSDAMQRIRDELEEVDLSKMDFDLITQQLQQVHPHLQLRPQSSEGDIETLATKAALLLTVPLTDSAASSSQAAAATASPLKRKAESAIDLIDEADDELPVAMASTNDGPAAGASSNGAVAEAGFALGPRLRVVHEGVPHFVFFRGLCVTEMENAMDAAAGAAAAVSVHGGMFEPLARVITNESLVSFSSFVLVEQQLRGGGVSLKRATAATQELLQLEVLGKQVQEDMHQRAIVTFEHLAAAAGVQNPSCRALAYTNVQNPEFDSMRSSNQQVYTNSIVKFMTSVAQVCADASNCAPHTDVNVADLLQSDLPSVLNRRALDAERQRLMRMEAHRWMAKPCYLSPRHPQANALHLNPYVSLTDNFFHAVRYAAGNKVYTQGMRQAQPQPLLYGLKDGADALKESSFDYDTAYFLPRSLTAEQRLIGSVAMFFIPEREFQQLQSEGLVNNVQQLHDERKVKAQARYLPEREFTFFGYLPARYVQRVWQLRMLPCEDARGSEWQELYNMQQVGKTAPQELTRLQDAVSALVRARALGHPHSNLERNARKAFMALLARKVAAELSSMGLMKLWEQLHENQPGRPKQNNATTGKSKKKAKNTDSV